MGGRLLKGGECGDGRTGRQAHDEGKALAGRSGMRSSGWEFRGQVGALGDLGGP